MQHSTCNQDKGFSLILSAIQEWQKWQHENITTRNKRKNSLESILFWSADFCGSSNPPFKGKTETTATTRYSMILFISTSRIYALWWKSRIMWTTFSLFLQRTGRTKTPPFDTSELLQQFSQFRRWRPYILVVTCLQQLWFSIYLILTTGRKRLNQRVLETESYMPTNSI